VFEHFDERAREVIVLAQDEARLLKHNYLGTEHLLLGLLRSDGVASRVLESFDIAVEDIRLQVVRVVGQGDETFTGQIPFTPRAKRVLEHSLRESVTRGHGYIGTEHILLGVVTEDEGVAAKVLVDFDADPQMVRGEVYRFWAVKEPSKSGGPEQPVDERSVPPMTFSRGLSKHQLHLSGAVSSGPRALVPGLWLGLLIGALIFAAGLIAGRLIWG
jgi:ATP-dependent Clp protease ATP-binding subunit ClpC